VLEDVVREGRVEGGVREGQAVEVAGLEARVGDTALRRQPSRSLQPMVLQVHADDLARRDGLRQAKGDRAAAAAGVQQRIPGRR
jgi:hypothetical protein